MSQQGKAYTPEQKESIIKSLETYLTMGFSRNKACELIGLNPVTLHYWIKDDEALLIKIQGWENIINAKAMQNIADAIDKESEMEDNRKETTKWWLERKMKHEFSTKTESEVKLEMPKPIIDVHTDNSDQENKGSETEN